MAMKIKQIELIGFKSFADRTCLRFHDGITCIVGPNGCGKSNIVDAFKWVLGELSAKSLRGDKMEDVIFQGSSSKKQKGMAEVILTLSQSSETKERGNGNGGSAKDSEEIIVSRRLYRSGESEYFLNKRPCRLKDIRDIFLDTGLDIKSYYILDQGRIEEIINAKPLERRFLIEEVAGVMKYKVRKTEALSKLDSSKQNLQRINDIIQEVKRQVNSLDRLAKKAERYKRFLEELKILEIRVARIRHLNLTEVLNKLLSEIHNLKESESLKKADLSTLENLISTKRIELIEKEKALSELERLKLQKNKEISDIERTIAVLKEQIENKRIEISRLNVQIKESEEQQSVLNSHISEIIEERDTLLSRMKDISNEIEEREEWIAGLSEYIEEKESEIEDKRKSLFRISENISNKKNELQRLQSSIENLLYKESISQKDINTITISIETIEKTLCETEYLINKNKEKIQGYQSEKERLIAEINRIRNDMEVKRSLLSNEREGIASNNARLQSLKELLIDRSLTDIFKGEKNEKDYRLLSDVISTNREYEVAIESALSEKVNSLLIDSLDDIVSAINIIKEKHLGKTAILYTSPFNDKGITTNNHETEKTFNINTELILGRASDFISFENGESLIAVQNALSNTYVVKDINTAFNIFKSVRKPEITLVTLDGEVITFDGWIIAGYGKEILKRKREIKELQENIRGQQERITMLENSLTNLASDLEHQKNSLKEIEGLIIDIEKEQSLLIHSLNTYKEEKQRKLKRIDSLKTEISTISLEKESLYKLISSKKEEIERLEYDKNEMNNHVITLQHSLSSKKSEYEELRSHLTDMRLSLTSLKEKIEALKKEEDITKSSLKDIENKKIIAEREIIEAEKKIEMSLSELKRLEEDLKIKVVESDNLNKEIDQLKEFLHLENQELLIKEDNIKSIRKEIDEISSRLSELNSEAVEKRLIKENIEIAISQKYGIDIKAEIVEGGGFDPIEDEKRINELNEKIREIGPVNLDTIEEYEELKKRYDFLTKQQQDLTMSIAELEEAIGRINLKTKRKLREAYDSLRAKFSEVFHILFGGGKADLLLTDENNILESGLEIVAQPPGKRLQNLNLLSGGEKALTSLALLFAGFLIKPSPLCILDEADAPLDESNTMRFAQMIKNLSKETQFIIITHNKTTMEASDYIYGITMEEPGVSKSISLQLVEN